MGSGQVLVILANLPCVLILGIVNFIPLLFLGEGNGNPLQCSCLENPRDGGAWGAAVCGVAQSRTRLKRLSSSIEVISHLSFPPGLFEVLTWTLHWMTFHLLSCCLLQNHSGGCGAGSYGQNRELLWRKPDTLEGNRKSYEWLLDYKTSVRICRPLASEVKGFCLQEWLWRKRQSEHVWKAKYRPVRWLRILGLALGNTVKMKVILPKLNETCGICPQIGELSVDLWFVQRVQQGFVSWGALQLITRD